MQILKISHTKRGVEIEAWQMMRFGLSFGGAGGREETCLTMQLLKNGESI